MTRKRRTEGSYQPWGSGVEPTHYRLDNLVPISKRDHTWSELLNLAFIAAPGLSATASFAETILLCLTKISNQYDNHFPFIPSDQIPVYDTNAMGLRKIKCNNTAHAGIFTQTNRSHKRHTTAVGIKSTGCAVLTKSHERRLLLRSGQAGALT